MDKEKALSFLKENQPMPDDINLDENLISMYDEVRKYFLVNPSEECLPLFLNSFGEYEGMGVYQLVEDVILNFNHDKVIKYLSEGLKSKYNGVRYWCAQICEQFPDEKLIYLLEKLLSDPNPDIRMSAITSLLGINDDSVINILKNKMRTEEDIEIREFLVDVIEELEVN